MCLHVRPYVAADDTPAAQRPPPSPCALSKLVPPLQPQVPQEAGFPQRFRLRMPKLPMYFTGTGDLVAALLLARTADMPGRLTAAVELAIASVQGAAIPEPPDSARGSLQIPVCARRAWARSQNLRQARPLSRGRYAC